MKTEDILKGIILEQSQIIGERLAREMATETGVVKFNSAKIDDITITNPDSAVVIEKIVDSYKNLFGQASVEVCMDVIRKFPADEIRSFLPEKLKVAIAS